MILACPNCLNIYKYRAGDGDSEFYRYYGKIKKREMFYWSKECLRTVVVVRAELN